MAVTQTNLTREVVREGLTVEGVLESAGGIHAAEVDIDVMC